MSKNDELAEYIERSTKTVKYNLGNSYFHVDNGGVDFSIVAEIHDNNEEPAFLRTQIKFSAQYFGYPSIDSVINCGTEIDESALREIGIKFIAAAEKLTMLREKNLSKNELIVALINEGQSKHLTG